ncbi:8137_t:CDS:2 [Rhizophagus irregularis]|nr:8137_t:CDS:2 [Rhizophagus irregularis]
MLCNHEIRDDQFGKHRGIEGILDRVMKWGHFLKQRNVSMRYEPIWYKMLSEKVRDITKRKENNKKVVLRKELPESSKKEKNKEFITWKKNEDMVYSIMNKKSRSKVYDEVEKHLIECKVMGQDNDISDSLFLKDCNGCEFNIGRKLNTGNV